MDYPVLQIAMRYVHVVSVIAAVGGILFAMVCVKPALKHLEDELRESVAATIRRRFSRVLLIAIVGLIVSGIYNWILLMPVYREMPKVTNALIGSKVLLAMIMFAVVFMRSTNMIRSDKAAQMINIHLAAIIILLAVVLRYMRLTYLAP